MAISSLSMRIAMNPNINQQWLKLLYERQQELIHRPTDPARVLHRAHEPWVAISALPAAVGEYAYESIFTLEAMLLAIQHDHPTIFQRIKDEAKLAASQTGILPALRNHVSEVNGAIVMQNAHMIHKLNRDYSTHMNTNEPNGSILGLPDSIPHILQTYSRANLSQADRAFIERNSERLIEIMLHHLSMLHSMSLKHDGYFEFRHPTAFKNPLYGQLSGTNNSPDWEYYSGIGVTGAVNRIMNAIGERNWPNPFSLGEQPRSAFNWWHEEASYARFKFRYSKTEIILAPRSVHWLNLAPVMKRILIPQCSPLPVPLLEDTVWLVDAQNIDQEPTPVIRDDCKDINAIATHLYTVAAIFTALAFAIPSGKGNHKPQWMSTAPNSTFIKSILAWHE